MIPRFRGLSIDENSKGKMQYGYLIADGEQAFIINEVVEANEQYITIGSWCPVDPKTIGQSTGPFDKNGKEIFEGDVIAIEVDDTGTPINARVFQNSKIGVLMFHVFEDNEDVPMVELLEDNSVAFEIIGNIYENPELLEEK
jgi:uncharacterized phage protein (TIGR01671 family)